MKVVGLIALGLCVTSLIGAFAQAAPQNRPKPEIDYFALGDSVASGWGLLDDSSPCRRSTHGYPYKVAEHLAKRYTQVNLSLFACSGASTLNPPSVTDQDQRFSHQVDEVIAHLSSRPTLVTITIGANDLGWADLLPLVMHMISSRDVYEQAVDNRTAAVATALQSQIARLLAYPNVAVIITAYYNPINPDSVYFQIGPIPCDTLLGAAACYTRMDYGTRSLNAAFLRETATTTNDPQRLAVVSRIYDDFVGHESPQPACGRAGILRENTWIQYLDDPNSNGMANEWVQRFLGRHYGDCSHPNDKGAAVYAEEIDKAAQSLGR